ncbi:hypothetical protein [Streptomyces sp. NPDC060184]|uniref:hypothetical protein n=1 Tax=Streptomyces sp. NPDC060184 TaxID=3347064 RepID=UPI003650B269
MATTLNGQQSSSDKTFNDSITYLEIAKGKLHDIKGEVGTEHQGLGNTYGGEDGTAYGRALQNWLDTLESIRTTCTSMEEALRTNQTEARQAQQHNVSLVADATRGMTAPDSSISGTTFAALHPQQ